MADAIRIDSVAEHQAPAVAAFQIACWQQAYRGIVPDAYLDRMDPAARTEAWRERVVSGRRRVAAAWDRTTLVGVVSWTTTASPDGVDELKTLYVDAAWHGSGVARTLLRVALEARPARLWVFDANTRARRFYAKHGFAPTGVAQVDLDTGVDELELARP